MVSDGARVLAYRGFACDIDRGAVGGVENGQPVLGVATATEGGAWCVTHRVAGAAREEGGHAGPPQRAALSEIIFKY